MPFVSSWTRYSRRESGRREGSGGGLGWEMSWPGIVGRRGQGGGPLATNGILIYMVEYRGVCCSG